jgi:hypothetical protein
MSTQDFGLSFTVAHPALWNDFQEGKNGPASTILSRVVDYSKNGPSSTILCRVVSFNKHGPSSTVLCRMVSFNKHGPSSTVEIIGLCYRRLFLSGPERSVLNGPGLIQISC